MTYAEKSLKEIFKKQGYVLIPQVLDASEVTYLRKEIEQRFQDPILSKKRMLTPKLVLAEGQLYQLPFREKVTQALKSIFGENYHMLPDFQLQRNIYGTPPGWHQDSGSEIPQKYLVRNDYLFAKCGIYLQENGPWGGGIDILKKGHRFPLPIGPTKLRFKAQSLMNRINHLTSEYSLPNGPGDLVIFDSRLPHRSTYPQENLNPKFEKTICINIPPEKSKYVLYWNVCAHKEDAKSFLEHSARREKFGEPEGEKFFGEYIHLKYPESYPSDFVAQVQKNNLQVAYLD